MTHRKPYHIIYTWQGKVCPHLPTLGTRQKKHMTVFKILKKVADKVSDTMETKKKFTVSRRRMKKAEDIKHSVFNNSSISAEGKNRVKGGKAIWGLKGGVSRDVKELGRHMERQDKYVDKNVNAFKVLKSIRDKVKKKKMSKEEGKSIQGQIRSVDIVKPNRRGLKSKPPPGGAESKSYRGFKKGVKKEFKRSEREDSLTAIERDMYVQRPSSKPKPSMFIKRKN